MPVFEATVNITETRTTFVTVDAVDATAAETMAREMAGGERPLFVTGLCMDVELQELA